MKNTKKPIKKIYIIIAAIIVIAACLVAWFILQSKQNNSVARDSNGTSLERSNEELKETDTITDNPSVKEDSGSDIPATPEKNPETGLNKVNVILTSTGTSGDQVDASGFVSNVVENGGKCTFLFTQGSKTLTKTSTTSTNPTSTTCATVRFNKSELSTGEWKVVIEYRSETSYGKSNESSLSL